MAIYAGLRGTEAPDRNFALTFLYVTTWLGFPLFSVFLGDVFRPFNPWRAVGRAAGAAFAALAGQRPAHLRYPERLGRWPAAIGLIAVVWLEIVYGASGGVAVGLDPHAAALGAVVYSVYTLAMMALFGVEQWCRTGEVFSVYFGMFGRLGCFGVEDGRLGVRRPLAAATTWATVPGSAAVVIASIATTSFDGAQEGAFKGALESTFNRLVDVGLGLTSALRLTDTIFMLLCFAGVGLVYLIGVRGMASVPGAPSFQKLRSGFAHTLIPIAFAYLVAHYFSLFVFQEQAQFTYLLSDPLGTGTTDLFGTASSGIDFRPAQRQRDLVRPGRRPRDRPRHRSHPRPRPRHRLLGRLPPGGALAVLDAGGDGRLHLLRPLPALGGQRLTARRTPTRNHRENCGIAAPPARFSTDARRVSRWLTDREVANHSFRFPPKRKSASDRAAAQIATWRAR